LGLLFFGLPSQYNSFHLISFGVTQTVLLTAGPRSKPQNSRFIPKFSEAEINPKTNNINTFYILKREGKPRNGANCSQNDSANKASVAGARFGCSWHFGCPFLWFISFGQAKEMNKNIRKTKK
jgi:hypothetical protein